MYNLFVDESYQHSHYYVAGVLVDEKQCRDLEARLDDLAQGIQTRNQWLAPPEFHGHALMNGLDDWKSLSGHFGACVNIYQKVMHAIQNSGARVYLEGVDVKRLNARYKYPDSPHEIALRHTLERVNEYCAIAGQMCKVIADTVPQQDQFNEAIQGFVRTSTPGYRGQRLLCVNGDIEFVDSRVSRGVQAADMSAYVLRRYREEKTASKAVRKANARLVKALGPALVH
ncbi:hypothetical protein A4R63_07315 [Corynebacterium pseudotuberculosis]|nr:DUF3800 domain-containing protein [Corynebacterium pseudotuberculosis]APB11304.1 hypothetical protein A4R72_07545 [Corynebacterium pseudotuberculosis]APB13348.1 hypothetical protein A4R71_07560 [Corynebacterium pseudotuberculosis]APB15392.1 hypothetical protein A4R68_07555 [Corynebacterium pseudotuberculosis]APB17437.1 hypothetical protein A4R67_07530 [Corynebacterium pseudotuberculosis]APB19484.1 hypothetical protein A4R66_07535 [Corynebacterium pseudotuberculosis]